MQIVADGLFTIRRFASDNIWGFTEVSDQRQTKKKKAFVNQCTDGFVHTSYAPSVSAQPTGRCNGLVGPHGACDSSPAVFHPAAQSPWDGR